MLVSDRGGFTHGEPPSTASQVDTEESDFSYYSWGGRLRRVPEDFTWPRVSALSMYRLWHCGNKAEKVSPFEMFEPIDMPSGSARKRLSDVRYLCNYFDAARATGGQPAVATYDAEGCHAAYAWLKAHDKHLQGAPETAKKRKRRPQGLAWRTVGNRLLKRRKTLEVVAEEAAS